MPDHQSTPRAEPPRVFGDNDSVEGVDARERRSPQSDKEQRATKSRVGVDAAAPKTSSRSLCLLVASEVLVELAATVFAAVLLFVYGGGGESAAIRCDLAAVGILAAVTTGFVVQFIAETCSSPDPQRPESTAARVGRLLRTSLRVICAGLVVCAFLAHATLVLAVVLATIGSLCGVLCFCSFAARFVRWFHKLDSDARHVVVDSATHGLQDSKLPPAVQSALKLESWRLLFSWCLFEGLVYAVLRFKPWTDLGLPLNLGHFEVWSLYLCGGWIISAGLWSVVLCVGALVSTRVQALLVLRQPVVERDGANVAVDSGSKSSRMGTCNLLLRATGFSLAVHAATGAFVFLIVYGVLVALIVLLTRFSLSRGQVSPGRTGDSKAVPNDNNSENAEQETSLLRVIPSESQREREDFRKTSTNRTAKPAPSPTSKSKKGGFMAKAKKIVVTGFMLGFGFVKVAMLFVVFLFDMAFVQRHLSGTATLTYVKVRADEVCGTNEIAASGYTADAADCASIVARGASAFSLGRGTRSGECRAYTLPSEYSKTDYDLAAQFPASWDCVNATVDAGWKASVGFDFYVLEPRKSCSVIGSARRLAATSSGLNVSNSTSNVSAEAPASEVIVEGQHVPLFAGTFEVPQAMHHLGSSIGSEWLGQAMEDITGFLMRMFRRAFKVRTRVPQEINLQCASPRRLASGLALLSAVVGISAVAYLDVLSVLAASTEIAKARASTAGGFVRYAMIMARAQAFEQVGWTLLQVGISSAVSLQAEVVGVFKRHCGVLVREDNLYRRECPIFWEAPVDFCATAVIFVALLLGFAAIASVFGGVCFGLSTSRWAVATLFGRYLHISTVTEPSAGTYRPQMSRRMSTDLSLRKHATFHRWLIQPILGLAVTLGVWNTTLTRNFQICNRQNRYQPICVNTQEEQGALVEDLVSWKSMYRATAKLVSLAWLPFPLIGGLLSKACEYMNQHVIFAFGDGGGSTPEDQEPILHYFEEETPHAVHLLHWGTSVAQLFLLVLIQFDIVGMIGNRVLAISICMGVIIVLAILRVAADLVQELKVFLRRRGILDCASQLVADKIPSRVVSSADEDADWAKFGDGVDANPLLGLCVKHRARLVHACAELCELPWVQQGILPSAERSALMSARWRRSPHFQHASKLSRALAAEQENVSEGALRAAILLLLHEVVEVDICKERARKVARFETRARARKHAEDSGQDMHMRAEDEAREQACREARRRVQAIGDVKRLVVAKENRGEHVDIPTDLPCWVRIRFQASRTYKSQMVGRWEATANDLTEVIISSVTSVVSGEVELHWSSTRTNSDFSFADAVVVSSSHKTVPSWEAPPCADDAAHELWDDGEELFEDSACEIQLLDGEGSPVAKAVRGHHAGVPQSEDKESQQEQDEKTCVICSQNEERVPNSGCCRCFSSPSEGQQQHASPGQKWALVDLGVAHGPSDEDVGNAISCPYEDWSWLATVTPVVSIPDVRADLDVEEAMQELEAALRANESVSDAQVLSAAGSFLTALQSSKAQSAVVKAGRRAQMLSVASRMLRTTREGKVEPSVCFTRSDSAAQSDAEEMNTKHAASTDSLGSAVLVGGPAERLRGALGRRPVDADELSVALDEGRRANIDPLLLAQAEERFVEVLDQQRAARLLTQALQSRRIAELRRAVMKAVDAGIDRGECFCGEAVGLVERARAVLREEEENCLRELREAVKAGAAAPLERALEQAHAAGLSSRDQQIFSSAEVLLQRLREREDSLGKLQKAMSGSDIETLRNAIEKYEAVCAVAHESTCASDGDEHLRRGMNLLKKLLVDAQRAKEATATPAMKPPIPPTTVHRPQLTSLKLVRASAMLRGALQQENQDPSVLRLALREAVDAGVVGADVERAEELVRLEDQNDQFLDSLRESSRAKNERAVAEALARCHRKGVDPKRLLAAIVMLIEEHARTALMTGDHGLSCAGLDDLETHRRDLHESIQKGLGGLRRICRIRAPLASERINVNGTGSTGAEVVSTLAASPGDNLAGHGGQMVAFRRLDRVTVVAADERTFRFTSVFGPDSIQAEIFNEVRGLVQSAIDGFNVSIFSCGAQGSGKTYLIRGGTTTEGRGIIPRALDELFAIRDRDAWRATIEVELQMVEVVDSHNLVDILCARGVGGRDIGSRPSVRLSRPNGDRSCGGGNVGVLAPGASHVIIDGAASRLVVNRSQAKTVVEEGFWRRTTREASVASRNGHGGTSEGGASGRGGTHAAIGVAASSIISGNRSVASQPAATTFSHNLILFVHITRTNRANGATSRGKLVFADLAGCGEACPPESNAAYTSFGNVLRALAAGQQRSRVPFRDHALTNLLQDCLGGTSKTALLLSLPPCRSLAGESKAMFEDALRSIDLATCASW